MMTIGMCLTLTTVDGGETQIAQMLIGLAAFAAGAFMAKAYDFQQGRCRMRVIMTKMTDERSKVKQNPPRKPCKES